MNRHEKITSAQNPKIKNLKLLEKASERKEQNLFVIEGMREIILANQYDYQIKALYICEEIFNASNFASTADYSHVQCYYVSKDVYDTLAYRGSTEGIIATVVPKTHALENLRFKGEEDPLVLVIEAVEKPGNLGAMLRTCDAAAVDAVIICDAKTDIYNPNVIRSSIGTLFTNQVAVCDTREAIEFLKKNQIAIFTAEPEAKKFHYEQNFNQPSAIVVGTEATGLGPLWMQAAAERIKIPMLGKIDSLNVSVSAAVLLFEAVRQRS